MRVFWASLIGGFFLISALLSPGSGASEASSSVLSLKPEDWASDLAFLVSRIETIHPNPYTKISREDFHEEVEGLSQRLSQLEDHEVRVGMMRLVARISDGHSNIWPSDPRHGFRRWFPLRLRQYADGVFVETVDRRYSRFCGARVLEIGEGSAEEILQVVARVASGDNQHHRRFQAPYYLASAEVLLALEIIRDGARLPLLVEVEDGEPERVVIDSLSATFDGGWFYSSLFGLPAGDPVSINFESDSPLPLHLSRGQAENFWFERVEKDDIFFVQINAIRDTRKEKFVDFSRRMWKAYDAAPTRTFVLDIRYCGGGNNTLLLPLVHGFIKRDHVNKKGSLFTIIGGQTFSAAMNLAVLMERHTTTLFVGEPTGASVNEFAEVKGLELPRSRLWVNISRYYWQNNVPWDHRPWIKPHIDAPMTSRHARENRDPALEAVLRWRVR